MYKNDRTTFGLFLQEKCAVAHSFPSPTSRFLALWPDGDIVQSDIVFPALIQLSLLVEWQILPVGLPCRTTPTPLSLEAERTLSNAVAHGFNPSTSPRYEYAHLVRLSRTRRRILSSSETTTTRAEKGEIFSWTVRVQEILWVFCRWMPSLLTYRVTSEGMYVFGKDACTAPQPHPVGVVEACSITSTLSRSVKKRK